MLLRNSGHFLERLLAEGFHLVLHGHLHRHNRGQYQAAAVADQRLVEIIAAGACLRAGMREGGAFNVLRLYRDGYIEGAAFRMDFEGAVGEPLPLRAPPYEAILRRPLRQRADRLGGPARPVRPLHAVSGSVLPLGRYRDS